MLPEILLDNEDFKELLEEAKGKTASFYPEWTDHNYHDPGITLLELFSWLQEIQHYYVDQIGEEHKDKYIKLLGNKRFHKKPARTLLNVDTPKNFFIPKGTRFWADDICFETVSKNYMVKDDIVKCFYLKNSGINEIINKEQLWFGTGMNIEMFGKNPEPMDCFYLGFDSGLCKDTVISIYFRFYEEWQVKRNPVKGKMSYPLIHYELEYFTENGWERARIIYDKTNGFLQSGKIVFSLSESMVITMEYGQEAYYLRFRIQDGAFDVPPIIHDFGINVFMVEQTQHLFDVEDIAKYKLREDGKISFQADKYMAMHGSNNVYKLKNGVYYEVPIFEKYLNLENGFCTFVLPEERSMPDSFRVVSYEQQHIKKRIIGEGNGFPFQEISLDDKQVEYFSFDIMIQDFDNQNGFVPWKKVNDFGESGPSDRHYILDVEKGLLKFGDAFRGMPPEGLILAVCYVHTCGEKGNVKAEKIVQGAEFHPKEMIVRNMEEAFGGKKEETYEECFARIRKSLAHSSTAVTSEDYERYVKHTPGLMIAACKVLTCDSMKEFFSFMEEADVSIVVKPFSSKNDRQLSTIYKKNIMKYLEYFVMVGTEIRLLQHEYIEFFLYVEVEIKIQYVDAWKIVKRAVSNYFEELENQFGATISYNQLYGIIELQDCVSMVKTLSIETSGYGVTRLLDQSIVLPPYGVPKLVDVDYQFAMEM